MTIQKMRAAVEAILFAAGEPLEITKIAQSLEVEEDDAKKLLDDLEKELDERESGICLLRLGDRYQLCTRQDYAVYIRNVLEMKKNAPLSSAAFEVLAVVAYNQPVTKSYVEQVRGVDCSGVMATLCQKGLVEEKGRLELPGRPLLYGTTDEFLKCFCLESLLDLPELPSKEEEKDENVEQNEEQAAPEKLEQDIPSQPEEIQADDAEEDDFDFDDFDVDAEELKGMYD